MKITDISISYEATQSLSEYSNVRPGIRISAHLDEGDNPETVRLSLLDEARAVIQSEIDDVLIADDRPPRYYNGPRYRVLYNRASRTIVVLPEYEDVYCRLPERGNWVSHPSVSPSRRMRLDQARNVAARLAAYMGDGAEKTYTVVDCYDGDLSRLAACEAESEFSKNMAEQEDTTYGVPGEEEVNEDDDEEEF